MRSTLCRVMATAIASLAFIDGSIAAAQFDARIELSDALLPIVDVRINGNGPHRFVLDTAATTTTLDPVLATTLDLASSGSLQIVTAGGSFTARTAIVDRLHIGEIGVDDLRVTLISLDALREDDERIVGVIGQDVLARFTVTIDYAQRRARLDSAPCAAADASAATTRADGRPMVDARLSGRGLPAGARLVIDSAANGLILFGQPSATPITTRVTTHGQDAHAEVVPGATIGVGDVELRGAAVVVPAGEPRTEHGLLPASWFSRVCIDGPRAMATFTVGSVRPRD